MELLVLGLLVGAAKLLLTLSLLLRTSDKELPALEILVVKSVNGNLSRIVALEVDEAEALAVALFITLDNRRRDRTELAEQLVELVIRHLGVEVFHVDVCELRFLLGDLSLTLLFGDIVADVDLLVVQQHSVNGLDGRVSCLRRLVVDKAVSARTAVLISRDLAREDIAESSKGIVQSL